MRRLSWFVLLFILAGLVGCGESGPERIGMSGTVTYNGEPIFEGEISFLPADGTQAPPTSTTIMDGKYQLPAKWALVPGTYNVSVMSYKPADSSAKLPGSELDRPPATGGIQVRDQLLPDKFNTKTTIPKITVKSGDPQTEKNFDLKD